MKKIIPLSFLILIGSCSDSDELMDQLQLIKDAAEGEVGNFLNIKNDRLASNNLALSMKPAEQKVKGILEAIGIETKTSGAGLINDENVPEVSDDALAALQASQKWKKTFDQDSFLKLDEETLVKSGTPLQLTTADESVTWTHSENEFTVSNLDKQPVRDQGKRATCAAFTGLGQIEAIAMKKYSLEGIDLSEQRFYYMSKPEHWSDGGDVKSGGSNPGTGFAKSNGFEVDGTTYPPDSPDDFNIPLESNCTYNQDFGDNDLQTPQEDSCKDGVVKVSDFYAWMKSPNSRLNTAQQIYDALIDWDVPIVVFTKLSENWENNDGMITLEGSGGAGATTHAAGHAYLVVGAKKIDESAYPDEGEMCFIIKNSWGTGWGVNGYSCMTLAWFNTWRFDTGFPQVLDIELDKETITQAQETDFTAPSGTTPPSGDAPPRKVAKPRKGKVSFALTSEETFGTWVYNNRNYKVFYKDEGDEVLSIKGLLEDNKTLTHPLYLEMKGSKLYFTQKGYPRYEVGELDSDKKQLILCSEEFSEVCKLYVDEDDQALKLTLTEEQTQKEESYGPYDWSSIGFGGYSLDFSLPSAALHNKVDVRLKQGETITNPLRFKVDVKSGLIKYHNNAIGSIKDFSLCNKDYSDVCRFIVGSKSLNVLFKAKKSEK